MTEDLTCEGGTELTSYDMRVHWGGQIFIKPGQGLCLTPLSRDCRGAFTALCLILISIYAHIELKHKNIYAQLYMNVNTMGNLPLF